MMRVSLALAAVLVLSACAEPIDPDRDADLADPLARRERIDHMHQHGLPRHRDQAFMRDARRLCQRIGRAVALAREHQRRRLAVRRHQAATLSGASVSKPCRSRLWPMMVSTSIA